MPQKTLVFLLLAHCFALPAFAGEECDTEYAGLKPEPKKSNGFVFDKELYKKIKHYCKTGEMPNGAGAFHHAELLMYMAS